MNAINLVDLREALGEIHRNAQTLDQAVALEVYPGSRLHRSMSRLAEMGEAILERAPFQPVARLGGSVVIDREAFEKIETEAAISAAMLRQAGGLCNALPVTGLGRDLIQRAEALEAAFLACRPSPGAPVRS